MKYLDRILLPVVLASWLALIARLPAAEAPAAVEVTVQGAAPAHLPNASAEARLDALRKAVEQVAGRQVRSLALTSYQQMLANYTISRIDGFVEAAEAFGPPETAGGVLLQRYRVRVRAGSVNQDLVVQKIDVDFLYEAVARPRIAIAVTDRTRASSDLAEPWQPQPGQPTASALTRYFKSRHPGFTIKDLDLLRDSRAQEVDYVREAGRNQFDLLVLGETRTWRRGTLAPGRENPWLTAPGKAGAGEARMWYDAAVEWRVVNVATRETLFAVSGNIAEQAEAAALASADAAHAAALERAFARKLPELFRELLAYWNRGAFEQTLELAFTGAGVDGFALAAKLAATSGLAPDSIQLISAASGQALFSVRATQTRDRLASALRDSLGAGFRIQELRPGRIGFVAESAAGTAGVRVELREVSLGDCIAVEKALAAVSGVEQVRRLRFSGGIAELQVQGQRSAEEIASAIESAGGGRISTVDLGPDRVVLRGGRP